MQGRSSIDASASWRRLVLLACTSLFVGSAPQVFAQVSFEGYSRIGYSYDDGLPTYRFTGIIQTNDAYLWLSSEDGVVRYDGNQFDIFDTSNTPAFSSNNLVEMVAGPQRSIAFRSIDGSVVIHNGNGFARIDSVGAIQVSPATALAAYPNGFLLVSASGLFQYDGISVRRLAKLPVGLTADWIHVAADSSIWIGGVGAASLRGNLLQIEIEPEAAKTANRLVGAYSDVAGEVWTISPRTLTQHAPAGKTEFPFPEPITFANAGYVAGTSQFWRDADGSFWLAAGNGFYTLRPGSVPVRISPGRSEEVKPPVRTSSPLTPSRFAANSFFQTHPGHLDPSNPDWTESRNVYSTIDHEGDLWLALVGDGLYHFRRALVKTVGDGGFPGESAVTSVVEDSSGVIWITTPDHLGRLERGSFLPVAPLSGGLPQLYVDRSGTVWVYGFDGGYHIENGLVTPHSFENGMPVLAMYETSDGTFWHLTRDSLYARPPGHDWLLKAENGFGEIPVKHITETSDGALWIAGQRVGVSRYKSGFFHALTTEHGLSSPAVEHIYEDSEGFLWISTQGGGINFVDTHESPLTETSDLADAVIVPIRKRDGLASDVVHSIVEDAFGRFWMGSNQGIFYVSRSALLAFVRGQTANVRSIVFGESDGMRSRETNGGASSAIEDSNGHIWFSTQKGVVAIDPASLTDEHLLPPVIIEQVTTGNTRVPIVEGVARLGADFRSFEVHFAAVSFVNAHRVQFEYSLEGYDQSRTSVDRRIATYTQVPPGTYTFRVRATLGDYTKTGPSSILKITILPHFYENTWFRVLFFLFVAVLVGLAFRWRVRRLVKRQKLLENEVRLRTQDLEREKHVTEVALEETRRNQNTIEEQARKLAELDKAKSRFFENISHEFRTPLTLISGPLEHALDGKYGQVPEALHQQHTVMLKNSRRLLQLVNALMDLARLDAGRLALDLGEHDVSELVRSTFSAFESIAIQRDLKRSFRVREGVVGIFDRSKIEVVLTNLLANAVKFTPRGGAIGISADRMDNQAIIRIVDNGPGIPKEHLPHIFDRFYRIESTDQEDVGSGVGLALSKELIELHGGSLTAESPPAGGSTFVVCLPLAPKNSADDNPEIAGGRTVRSGRTVLPIVIPVDEEASLGRERANSDKCAQAGRTDKTTILIVEDNSDLRAFIRSILEPQYRVIEAVDGEDGLATAIRCLPDLIMADLMMPRMDGNAMNRAITADPLLNGIPLVVLTAKSAPESQIEGFRSGADAYLTKPFDAGVLTAVIESQLASRRRLSERLGGQVLSTPRELPEPASPWLQGLYDLIDTEIETDDLTPSLLADRSNLSYSQFARKIKHETGLSPTRLIRKRRIERAARMIRAKEGNMTEIAWAVGFKSLSYFARSFKEVLGVNPGEYKTGRR